MGVVIQFTTGAELGIYSYLYMHTNNYIEFRTHKVENPMTVGVSLCDDNTHTPTQYPSTHTLPYTPNTMIHRTWPGGMRVSD